MQMVNKAFIICVQLCMRIQADVSHCSAIRATLPYLLLGVMLGVTHAQLLFMVFYLWRLHFVALMAGCPIGIACM